MKTKKFVVWYRANAGGFFIAWLMQICLEPKHLEDALSSFPLNLKEQNSLWRKYEKTPNDIGVLCNMFHPNTYYQIDTVKYTLKTLDIMRAGGGHINDLLHCRIKFYLVNYVYKSGHFLPEFHKHVRENHDHYKLNDMQHIKLMTDILFNLNQNIFLVTPEDYLKMSGKLKKNNYYESCATDVIKKQKDLKIFNFETIFNGLYKFELEKVMNIKLNDAQMRACDIFVKRYIDVMPTQIKEHYFVN